MNQPESDLQEIPIGARGCTAQGQTQSHRACYFRFFDLFLASRRSSVTIYFIFTVASAVACCDRSNCRYSMQNFSHLGGRFCLVHCCSVSWDGGTSVLSKRQDERGWGRRRRVEPATGEPWIGRIGSLAQKPQHKGCSGLSLWSPQWCTEIWLLCFFSLFRMYYKRLGWLVYTFLDAFERYCLWFGHFLVII